MNTISALRPGLVSRAATSAPPAPAAGDFDPRDVRDPSSPVKIFEPPGPKDLKHDCVIAAFSWAPDARHLLSAQWQSVVRLWDLVEGKPVVEIPEREDRQVRVDSVAVSPDGNLLAASYDDGQVHLFDRSGQPRAQVTHTDPQAPEEVTKWYGWQSVDQIAFAPDSRTLASGGMDHNVCLWDTAEGRELQRFRLDAWVRDLAYAPGGKKLYALAGNQVQVLDLAGGTVERALGPRDPDGVGGGNLAVSPDGRRVAAVLPNGVYCWDAQSGAEVGHKSFQQIRGAHRIAFSPDGGHLLVGEAIQNAVNDWNLNTDQVTRQEFPHRSSIQSAEGVNGMAFSPDGQKLAISLLDYSLTLWVHQPEQSEVGQMADGLRQGQGGQVTRLGEYVMVGSVRLPVRNRAAG